MAVSELHRNEVAKSAMCLRVLLAVLLLTPTCTAAQEAIPSTTPLADVSSAVSSIRVSPAPQELMPFTNRWAEVSSALSTASVSQLQAATQHHCCNRKGAIIGAAIGGAIGFLFALHCDSGSCASTYVKYMVITGGIGATFGMFADRNPRVGVFPSDRRVQLGWVLAPRVRAGTINIAF